VAGGSEKASTGTTAGAKLEIMLGMFPRPDGEPWKLRELERATEEGGYRVSASHINQVLSGKIGRPRRKMRTALARAIGFPEALWDAEPDEWQGILRAEERREAREHEAEEARRISGLLQPLMERGGDPRTKEPLTAAAVAELSGGYLTKEDVERFLAGEVRPTRAQELALADAFGIDPEYFREGEERPEVLLDPGAMAVARSLRTHGALHRRIAGLSPEQRSLLDIALDRLERGDETGERR
jgi:transcriptional regulator with XRE-family HTH domain